MASTSSGVMFSAKRYIVSRHVQNVSATPPRVSVRPAMPRWNAWLCRLAIPGIANRWRSSWAAGAVPVVTFVMIPSVTTSCTSSAHPEGSRADAKCRVDMMSKRWITTGLVECHTHLVFGGTRAHEFELRLQGASYEEIARAGGGIVSTVAATRASSEAELVAGALPRADALIGEGVTTLEIKSGYGLNAETEMRQLSAARAVGRNRPVTVRTSVLAAHPLPAEADGDKDRYIDRVCQEMLPAAAQAGLADPVDAFMEGIAFSGEQTARGVRAAKALGLPVKFHPDQLSYLAGAPPPSAFSALSADHLEHTDEAGIAAMARA